MDGRIQIPEQSGAIRWRPDISEPHFVSSTNDEQVAVREVMIDIEFTIAYRFGYVSELTGSIVFQNLSEENSHLIFTWPDLEELRSRLTPFRSKDDLPNVPATTWITGVVSPEFLADGWQSEVVHQETGDVVYQTSQGAT